MMANQAKYQIQPCCQPGIVRFLHHFSDSSITHLPTQSYLTTHHLIQHNSRISHNAHHITPRQYSRPSLFGRTPNALVTSHSTKSTPHSTTRHNGREVIIFIELAYACSSSRSPCIYTLSPPHLTNSQVPWRPLGISDVVKRTLLKIFHC